MLVSGVYTGCVKSGNMGDDILFPIFVLKLAAVLEQQYGCNVTIKNAAPRLHPGNDDIGVLGGGSIVHPEETSYTIPPIHCKTSLAFGTGLSDSPRFPLSKGDINLVFQGNAEKARFPSNNVMQTNLRALSSVKHGGMRGSMDCAMLAGLDKSFGKPAIHDPGMMASSLFFKDIDPFSDALSLFGPGIFERNAVALNIAWVSSDNAIGMSEAKGDRGTFNHRLSKFLRDLMVHVVDCGYLVICCPMGEVGRHVQLAESIRKVRPGAPVFCHKAPLSPRQALSVCHVCDFMVGTRLHSNILAASAGTPPLVVAYNYKCCNFAFQAGIQDFLVRADALDVLGSISKIDKIRSMRLELSELLRSRVQDAARLHSKEISKVLADVLPKNMGNRLILRWHVPQGSRSMGRFSVSDEEES